MSRRSNDEPPETAGQPPPARSSPYGLRSLGAFEYVLLGLIALGIAVTVAMALVNP